MSVVERFLKKAGWAGATRAPIAGDASARRYTRLSRAGQTAILMEDPGGETARFARIAGHLRGLGLSAPRILASDGDLMLLEDLGDGLVARQASDAESEDRLYMLATDVLIALHEARPMAGLASATEASLAAAIAPAFTHYARHPEHGAAASALFAPILAEHAEPAEVMVLRDYHAENILFLPERQGVARAGLLDFQDALLGHRAYDLVSLLEDARRDVRPETRRHAIRRYLDGTGLSETRFLAAFSVLGAQRNLRILGIFARLAAERGKPSYLALIPRVWAHLQRDLGHPALAPLQRHLSDTLPTPDAAHLQALRHPCPTP